MTTDCGHYAQSSGSGCEVGSASEVAAASGVRLWYASDGSGRLFDARTGSCFAPPAGATGTACTAPEAAWAVLAQKEVSESLTAASQMYACGGHADTTTLFPSGPCLDSCPTVGTSEQVTACCSGSQVTSKDSLLYSGMWLGQNTWTGDYVASTGEITLFGSVMDHFGDWAKAGAKGLVTIWVQFTVPGQAPSYRWIREILAVTNAFGSPPELNPPWIQVLLSWPQAGAYPSQAWPAQDGDHIAYCPQGHGCPVSN